jgi:predicted amidophosphoribosyltransferase
MVMAFDLEGPWNKGKAFALHTLSSTYLGVDEFGHGRWENTRSDMGELVYRLKYQQDRSALPQIVELLDKIGGLETFDLFVPIPPTDKGRKFQPVGEITEALGHRRGVNVRTDILQKKPGGEQLKNVDDPVERERLLRESIYVENGGAVAGKRVLLIDDLYRSGATLAVATQALQKAGASYVGVLTMTKTRSKS